MAFGRSRQSEWFRRLIESTPEPITVVALGSGRLVDFNSAFSRTTGFKREESLGKTPFEIHFLNEPTAYDQLLEHPLVQSRGEFEFRTRDGEVRSAQTTTMAIEVAGQACLLIIWRDITERKQFENDMARARDSALESARLKSEFLANVSHELRTPLNGIIGMSQMLVDTSLTPDQQKFVNTIERSSESLFRIVSDILDFSKASSGQLHFEETDFDPRKLVEATLALLRPQAAAKTAGLKLTSSIDPAIPEYLRGDPGRPEQILTNLVGNAVKFTDSGEVTVVVAQEEVGDVHTVVRFEVKDTGIGISQADQQRLFQPFVQADGSSTRKYGGTGLGLAICAKLVELMNGKIGIHNTPGQGSTFYFTAQFAKAQRVADSGRLEAALQPARPLPEVTQSVSPPEADTYSGRNGVRILLVEDNLMNQEVTQRQLAKLGYRNVEVAANGSEALETLAKAHYDIVLMDCEMPVMNGREATEQIRRKEQGQKHTTVIAVTAQAFPEDRARCLLAGMDDYISRPLRLKELGAALERWRPGSDSAAAREAS